MRSIARTMPVIALLLLLTTAISSQPQPPVDFKSGGNTWTTTAVGDWVEYELKAGLRVRYELKAVAEDDTLTIEIVNYDSDGKETARREITRARDKAPTLAKLIAEDASEEDGCHESWVLCSAVAGPLSQSSDELPQ